MLPAARLPITLLVAVLCMEISYAMTIQRNYDPRTQDDMIMKPVKKPFCNAFTGCGRKRSLSSPGMPVQELLKQRQFTDEDNLTPLLDPDNSMDERLSRQILTEAKLWEALQEAAAELSRKRQREIIYN